jgi:hypothetical protein
MRPELQPIPLPDNIQIGARFFPFGEKIISDRARFFGPSKVRSPYYLLPTKDVSFVAIAQEKPESYLHELQDRQKDTLLQIFTQNGVLIPFDSYPSTGRFYDLRVHVHNVLETETSAPNLHVNGTKYPGTLIYETSWDHSRSLPDRVHHVYSWEPQGIFITPTHRTLKQVAIVFVPESPLT